MDSVNRIPLFVKSQLRGSFAIYSTVTELEYSIIIIIGWDVFRELRDD